MSKHEVLKQRGHGDRDPLDEGENSIDETYGSSELSANLPTSSFPDRERDPRRIHAAIRDELMLDGNSRQNLATFCQTWEEPEIHQLMDACIDKNMVDKDEYPQTAEIEARCVQMLAGLWHAPAGDHAVGCSTTGSSEAAMLGGLAMKRRWEARRQAQGKPTDKPNLITGPVQICWHKFTRYWDVEHREVPMDQGRLMMTPEEVLSRCDENTIGVVPTLGVTFTGEYEPVKQISDALDKLQADRGWTFRSTSTAPAAASWPRSAHLSWNGTFICLHTACYRSAEYLANEIAKLGPFEIVFNGDMARGIPAVSWKLVDGTDPGFTLFDLADRLRVRGWQVPAYTLPANCQDQAIQRILVRNGVSQDLCALLIDHMKEALGHIEAHPIQASLTSKEASGFHH